MVFAVLIKTEGGKWVVHDYTEDKHMLLSLLKGLPDEALVLDGHDVKDLENRLGRFVRGERIGVMGRKVAMDWLERVVGNTYPKPTMTQELERERMEMATPPGDHDKPYHFREFGLLQGVKLLELRRVWRYEKQEADR